MVIKEIQIPISSVEKAEFNQMIDKLLRNIIKLMSKSIGSDNAVSPEEMFEYVYGVNPNTMNSFKRQYYWTFLRKILRELRKKEILFVVIRKNKVFVLKTQEELKDYNKFIDRTIQSLKDVQAKATRWVNNESYKKFK